MTEISSDFNVKFKVCFYIDPYSIINYRHVWAKDLEHAEHIVENLIQEYKPSLESKHFQFNGIIEEETVLFSDYLEDLRKEDETVF